MTDNFKASTNNSKPVAKLNCGKCTFTTKNWYIFKQHLDLHEDKFCPLCDKNFGSGTESRRRYTSHIRSCKGKKRDPLTCDKCKKKFNSRQSKSSHKKVCGMIFKCDACDTIFPTKRRLTLHKCPNFQLPTI